MGLTLQSFSAPSTAAYAFTPDGFVAFFGDEARDTLVCRTGPDSYPLDLCEERFVVPNLVPRVLAHDYSFRLP